MGWNKVNIVRQIPLLEGIKDGEFFYFVHSYYADPTDKDIIAGQTDYHKTFASVVQRANLMATQFHPEKSSDAGLRILDNFAKIAAGARRK